MTNRGLLVVALLALLAIIVPRNASGDVRRERTERRPYVVEIGEPSSVSMATVNHESRNITELQEYLAEYGYPDYAEVQEIEPEWPWESYEVRLYYMRRNLETDFGHVFISEAMPTYGVLKYQGDISPDKRHQIEVILEARVAPPAPPPVAEAPAPAVEAAPAPAPVVASSGGISEAVVARLEAAAERAAQAADRAQSDSDAAARAADRTENIVNKMAESATPRSSH